MPLSSYVLAALTVLLSNSAFAGDRIVMPIDGEFEFTAGLGEPRKGHRHKGVDLGAATGTPIVSVWDGVVSKVSSSGNGGNSIWVLHPNGVSTFYAHMNKKSILKVGQEVRQGDVLGFVGGTGNATFPHLHFEMHNGKQLLDPKVELGM